MCECVLGRVRQSPIDMIVKPDILFLKSIAYSKDPDDIRQFFDDGLFLEVHTCTHNIDCSCIGTT
jgi:hypothetical protein